MYAIRSYYESCLEAASPQDVILLIEDGVYAGQCENVTVRDSTVYGNVIGIELENTFGGEVYNNLAYDNSIGIV